RLFPNTLKFSQNADSLASGRTAGTVIVRRNWKNSTRYPTGWNNTENSGHKSWMPWKHILRNYKPHKKNKRKPKNMLQEKESVKKTNEFVIERVFKAFDQLDEYLATLILSL